MKFRPLNYNSNNKIGWQTNILKSCLAQNSYKIKIHPKKQWLHYKPYANLIKTKARKTTNVE